MSLETVGGPVSTEGLSRLTTEHIYFPITTVESLAGVTASVAFITTQDGEPLPADWVAASIVNLPYSDPVTEAVRILVGPDLTGHDLTPASAADQIYYCWVKLETGSEIIVRTAGTLTVH